MKVRKIKREYDKIARDWKFDGLSVPMLKVFGQYIAFPCGNPKHFWRAIRTVAVLCNFSDKATKKAEQLEAQLLKIQELHSQLFPESTSSEEHQQS